MGRKLLYSVLALITPILSYAQTPTGPETTDRWPIIRGWDGVAIRDIVDAATGAVKTTNVGGSSGDGAIQDGVTPSIEATVRDYTNSNPLACVLTDTTGDAYVAGGGSDPSFGAAFPSTGKAIGLNDGTNMRPGFALDFDTGVGSQFGQGINLRFTASGGSVEAGIAANPFRTDPTGTTAQPASQSGVWNITNITGTVSLPTGAATEATLASRLAEATFTARFPTGSTPADNETNSVTITRVGSYLWCFDGTTWDRCPGNSTDGLLVNLGANNDVTVTGNVGILPLTTGGTSISRTVSAASTNATNVKASAGQVYQIIASNVNAAVRWVHLYNTSGTPTCTTSIITSFILPGNTTGAGNTITLNPGAAFGTGIGFCITTANDGTGAVSASDVVLNVFYK